MRITDAFAPFLTDAGQPDYTVNITDTDKLAEFEGSPIFGNFGFSVYRDENGFVRVYHDHRQNDRRYAYGRLGRDGKTVTVKRLPGNELFFSESHNTFAHIGLEELFIHSNAVSIHAAVVKTPLGGVLFSGASGIGKSTQAQLWIQYADARLINGDRAVLRKSGNRWRAYGSPYAGSSRCYVNDSTEIRAVVFLQQGNATSVRRLSTADGFRHIYANLTVNTWNPEFVAAASGLAEDAAAAIPVYYMSCTADAGAVRTLYKELSGGKI